jgi:hypothetical protein
MTLPLLQKLLHNPKSEIKSQFTSTLQKITPQQELVEVLRLGYWPVVLLHQAGHWLADKEPLDPTLEEAAPNDPVWGYRAEEYILDLDVRFSIELAQAGTMDCSGDGDRHETELLFDFVDFHAGNGQPVGNSHQRYTIRQFSDIEHALQLWPKFVADNWSKVQQAVTNLPINRGDSANSAAINDLYHWAWRHFNQHILTSIQAGDLMGRDRSVLDVLQAWSEGQINLNCPNP